ncbi:MAG: hypothetical protein HeimAB125_13960, partial [Candidatus Heimdallarchaeota archaeon AB_125]
MQYYKTDDEEDLYPDNDNIRALMKERK